MDRLRTWAWIVVHRKRRALGIKKEHPRGGDFLTACVFAMTLLGVTMTSVLGRYSFAQPSSSLSTSRSARMLFDKPDPAARQFAVRCVGSVRPIPRVQPCEESERKMWVWSASNAVRSAMDEKPCWWHVRAEELANIAGITEEYAKRAIALRDAADGPRFPGELEKELGAHRADLLAQGTSVSCAMMAWKTTKASAPR